jgi:thiosulfate dehydrogenase [quinone] large subunit
VDPVLNTEMVSAVAAPDIERVVNPSPTPARENAPSLTPAPIVELDGRTGAERWGVIDGGRDQNLRLSDWLYRSRDTSFLWLVVRLWLGYQWLNAGYQKLWGSEHAAFISGSGAGVKGFATAGIAGSAAGKGAGASYGWWAGVLHNFVVPNATWIGQFIAIAELLIGIGLVLGLLTGYAAFAGLFLNLVYMFTGSAGVNPAYAVLSVLLVLAWRNAGWIGLDRMILRHPWTAFRFGDLFGRATHSGAQSGVNQPIVS